MSFIEAAAVLVPALSGIPVTIYDGTESSLSNWEDYYCFEPSIQPWFTRHGLINVLECSEPNQIYELEDRLKIRIAFFKIEKRWIILGPYVTSTWNEKEMKELLAGVGLTTTHIVPYKLYRCNLTAVSSSDVLHTAAVIIENTVGNIPPREIKEISAEKKQYHPTELDLLESIEHVNQRYRLENQFMDAVAKGKTKLSIELLHKLSQLSTGLRYYTTDIRDSIAGAAIIRTFTRKASEQAGLTPVVIDAVSQEYAQQIHLAARTDKLYRLLEKYVSDVCALVRQEQKRDYSLHVKRAIQYIDVHISEPLSITRLSAVAGITPAYLAKLFHKETGMKVNQYIARIRCLKAAELLEESDLSVQEISAFVGYLDNNYFSKIFKRFMGTAPLEYRKKKTL